MADHLGFSRSAVSDIDRGHRRIDALELKQLAWLPQVPPMLGEAWATWTAQPDSRRP